MHLHIVFVLLYSICHSVNVLSCVDVIQSFTHLLLVTILDVTKKVRKREAIPTASRRYHPKTKTKKWLWLVNFVVAYFQPATSIDRLHSVFCCCCFDVHYYYYFIFIKVIRSKQKL